MRHYLAKGGGPPVWAVAIALTLCWSTPTFAAPSLTTIDHEAVEFLMGVGTATDAEISEERAKASLPLVGVNLVDGLKISFRDDCSVGGEGTYAGQDEPMTMFGVPTSGFLLGQEGYVNVFANLTHTPYLQRRVCMTATPAETDFTFLDTGILVSIYGITAIQGIEPVPKHQQLEDTLRTYKYSTVIYKISGIALHDRMSVSLQYNCKNNGITAPFNDELPANLYSTSPDRTESFIEFSRAQTDLPFVSKDVCISRGSGATRDYSQWSGVVIAVVEDCIEDPCEDEGACDFSTGACLCPDDSDPPILDICPGQNRNITDSINSTAQIRQEPLLCRDIKWGHYEPDRAVNQYYWINPTRDIPAASDKFRIFCDMLDGGWSRFNATYVETQTFTGGDRAECLKQNITYELSVERMENMRNVSQYGKQESTINCRSAFSGFSCPRDPYFTIHEGAWFEWTELQRLWPVYSFDGCCYECCSHSFKWGKSTASFWSINLPIRQVCTYYGGEDTNTGEVRIEMEPMKFY